MGKANGVPHVRCAQCNGTGRLPLTGEYLATYLRLACLGREATGAELGRLLGTTGSAMCNRLVALERLGLATSRRFGQKRLYRAAKERGTV